MFFFYSFRPELFNVLVNKAGITNVNPLQNTLRVSVNLNILPGAVKSGTTM